MRRVFIALIFFFSAVPFTNAEEPVRIGLSLGLTGKYSEITAMVMKGYRLWESDVNNRGGIIGRKVQLIIYDDKSDKETSKTLYEHLILKDKVDLLIAPYSTEIAEVVLPLTEKHHYPVLSPGAVGDSLWQKGYKYVFGVLTPGSRYTVSFLEMLVKNDLNDIAIVRADDPFSKDIGDGAKKWAERFGLNVVLYESFKKGTKSLDAIAEKVKTSRSRVLIVCGHFDEAVDMRRSLKNIGWYPKAFYASIGPSMQKFYDMLKSDADYAFTSSMWEHHGRLRPPGCNEFNEAYMRIYKEDPSYQAAYAFATGQILENAIKKAEGIDREKIRNILSTMDILTVIGRYGVDRTGMQVKHFNLIIQWQKGKKEIVWPEEFRTAKPVFR